MLKLGKEQQLGTHRLEETDPTPRRSIDISRLIWVFFTALMVNLSEFVAAEEGSSLPPLDAAERVPASSQCKVRILTTDIIRIADSTDFKDAGLVGAMLSGLYKKADPLAAFDVANSELGPIGQEKLISANISLLPPRFRDYAISFEAGGQRAAAAFQEPSKVGRLTSSGSSCVAEFSVVSMAYSRTSLNRSMAYLFMFRQFGQAQRATKVITHGQFVGVKAFPPKSNADISAAKAELSAGFIKAFQGLMQKIAKSKPAI